MGKRKREKNCIAAAMMMDATFVPIFAQKKICIIFSSEKKKVEESSNHFECKTMMQIASKFSKFSIASQTVVVIILIKY